MQSSDVPSPTPPFPFQSAVRTRAWDWLLALRRRLNIDLQLVDEHHTPALLPAPDQTTEIDRLLAAGAPPLRAALSAAMQTRTPHAVNIEGVQLVCFGLTADRPARGALILARILGERGAPPEQARAELEIIGLWLSNAVSAHLFSPAPASADGPERVSSLARLLADAAATGSDHKLVSDFADALAVWHDIELYGYVDATPEIFALEVSLPGADRSKVPARIQASALPEVLRVTRLSKADMDRLNVSTPDVLLARADGLESSGSWLLLMVGVTDAHDLQQLGAYITLFQQSVAQVAAVSAARVIQAMARTLVESEEQPEAVASAALTTLHTAVEARTIGLMVTAATGVPLLRVSLPAGVEDVPGQAEPGQLLVVRRTSEERTMALAVSRSDGRRLTPHDRYVARAAADLFETWTRRIARHLRGPAERRAASRSFDEVLEGFARHTLERGLAVTLVVLSIGDAILRPGVTQRWIGQMRGLLRASDLIGRLAEGEVGVLLYETTGAGAQEVAARLQRLAQETDAFGAPLRMSVGFASRLPGDPLPVALIQEARQNAFQRGRDFAS